MVTEVNFETIIKNKMNEAETKAWENLNRGKFSNFGYWAAKVVQCREMLGISHTPSPFADLVKFAKEIRGNKKYGDKK